MNRSLLAALMTVSLSAALPSAANAEGTKTSDCLFSSQPRSWRVLDQQQLIVWGPSQTDAYLLKLFAPVQDLRFTETLAFVDDDHNGLLCQGDKVAVPNSTLASFPTIISTMRKIDRAELVALGEQYNMKLVSDTKQHDKQAH